MQLLLLSLPVRDIILLKDLHSVSSHSLDQSLHSLKQKPVKRELESKKTPLKWAERARKYTCHFCWKAFVVRRDWEGHINSVHLKAKPFHCHVCSWSSAHRGELQKHVRRCSHIYDHLVKQSDVHQEQDASVVDF